MDFLTNSTFGWCFVLGEILVLFAVFMVVHRHALRRHEELTGQGAEGHDTEPSGQD
jgi:hypothetical protein